MFKLVRLLLIVGIVVAALINVIACQDISFRTKETDEPASIAFTEKTESEPEDEHPIVSDDKDDESVSNENAEDTLPENSVSSPVKEPKKTETDVKPSSPAQPAPIPTSAPEPTPAPAPQAPQPKYSVVGPDGQTYTSFNPIYIVCTCGGQFSSGSEWQSHHNYYAAFRCACGQSFSGVGAWESHAGIYDPATYMSTGKSYGEAAAEGHGLTNEQTHSAELTAHGGWRTS